MTVTLRDYPVTHCDDRHQATGGPIRGFAVRRAGPRPRPDRARGPRRRPKRRRPPGPGSGAVGAGTRPEPAGLLASMGAVVAGHATDLWGVVLVTVGVLAAWPSTPTPSARPATMPGWPSATSSGWGRFLVPPVAVAVGLLLLVGHRDGEDEARSTPEPARAVIGATLTLLAVAGLASLAGGSPPLRSVDGPPVLGRGLGRGADRQPAPGRPRRVRGRHRAGGRAGGGHGPVHRGVGPLGRRRRGAVGAVGGGGGPGRTGPTTRTRTTTDDEPTDPFGRAVEPVGRRVAADPDVEDRGRAVRGRVDEDEDAEPVDGRPGGRPSRSRPRGAPPDAGHGHRSWR